MTRRFSVGCLMFWQNDGFMVWRETKVAIAWLAPCVLSSLLYARMPVSCPVSSSPAQATHWILVDQPNADMVVKTMKWLNSQLWIFSHDWVFQSSIFRDHGSYNHVILGSEMSKSVAALGCLMFYVLVESWAGGHRPLCCLCSPGNTPHSHNILISPGRPWTGLCASKYTWTRATTAVCSYG